MMYIDGESILTLGLLAEGVRGDPEGGDTVPSSYADEGGPTEAPLNL